MEVKKVVATKGVKAKPEAKAAMAEVTRPTHQNLLIHFIYKNH